MVLFFLSVIDLLFESINLYLKGVLLLLYLEYKSLSVKKLVVRIDTHVLELYIPLTKFLVFLLDWLDRLYYFLVFMAQLYELLVLGTH